MNETQKVQNVAGYHLAIGYDFNMRTHFRFRVEAQYIDSAKVDYNPNPVFSAGTAPELSMKSHYHNQALFFNVYYSDVLAYGRFSPYIGGGIGLANNTVEGSSTRISNGAITHFDSTQRGLAWNVAIGTRIKLYKNWLANLAFQHLDVGSARWKTISSTNSLKVTGIRANGILVALTYQIP